MEKHNLLEDFSEQKEKIQNLKSTNTHFKKLYEEYDVVNNEIHRIEGGAEVVSEETINSLHSKRVHLKDQLYSFIKN